MKILLRFLLLLGLAVATVRAATPAKDLGDITVKRNDKTVPVRVSCPTPDLQNLALMAFKSHGRYDLVATGYAYDIKFTQVAPTQVRVDITKTLGTETVASETVTGTTARNALLRAADVAVTKTNGLGLRGFFASKLAYIREVGGKKEVCVGDLFFVEGKQITNDHAIALTPRWAPDGSRLIYTSYFKSGFPDIFTIDLASYQRTTFVSFKGTNCGARFSPSGQQVAMVLSGEGPSEIYVSNAQGRQVARRTHSDLAKSSPCWSADGGRLVFAMGDSLPQLHVMAAAGGTPSRLVTGFSYAAEPDWSRTNPGKIACTVRDGRRYQIAVYDFSKGGAEIASRASFDGVEPCWLADGRHLVYTARDVTTSRICILDTETGNSVAVSPVALGAVLQANVLAP